MYLSLVFVGGCEGTTEPPRIGRDDVSLQLGIAGVNDERGWNVLRIRLKNQGGNFDGTLEVRGTAGESGEASPERVTYRRTLDVPGKATTTKEVSFPVRAERWREAVVSLKQPGFSRELRFDLPQRAVEAEAEEEQKRNRILAIGNPAPELSSLASFIASKAGGKLDRVKITRVPSKDVSSCPAAFDSFRLVTVHGATFSDAPPGALDALSRWVESGGTLVVFPGSEWTSGLPEPFSKLIGVRTGDDREIPGDLAWRIGMAAASGFYRSLTPLDGTTENEDGIAFSSARGAGSVTTFCFSPTDESFPPITRAPGIFSALGPPADRALSFAGNARLDLHALEGKAEDGLIQMAAFRVPDRSSVVYGLLLYLTLGFFLPAAIFRALKRPEWTYAAVIAASATFTFGIYRYGLLSTRESAELCEITILRVHEDGKTAEATSFIGLMSPVAERVVLWNGSEGGDHPLAAALPQPLAPGKGGRAAWSSELFSDEQVIHVDRAGRLRLGEVSLLPNEIRCFRYDYRTDASGILEHLNPSTASLAPTPEAASLAIAIRKAFPAGGADPERPSFEVTATRAPVFPGGEGIPERKAITLVVRERRPERAK